MKKYFSLLVTVGLSSFILFSCSKKDSSPVPPVDTNTARLPKQIILTDPIADPLTPTKNYSIKYDTNNYTIGIYLDDLTNSNPYDKLTQEFKYNTSGYLISNHISPGQPEAIEYNINRSADNKIVWISHTDNLNNTKDTAFFTYETFPDSLRIHIDKHLASPVPGNEISLYTYNNLNRITRAEFYNGETIRNYTYNANGSLNVKSSQSSNTGDNYTVSLTYTSSTGALKYDSLKMELLGKDFYLDDINEFYPFVYKTLVFTYSLSDPYDISKSQEVIIFPGSGSNKQYYFLSQEHNTRSLLTKMNVAETLGGTPLITMQLVY